MEPKPTISILILIRFCGRDEPCGLSGRRKPLILRNRWNDHVLEEFFAAQERPEIFHGL